MTPETHHTLRELLGAFALGHLSAAEQETVRSHLEGCVQCRRELSDITPAVDALAHLGSTPSPKVPPPQALGERIVASLAQERTARERHVRNRWVMIAAAAVTAVLTIGGIGGVIGHEVADRQVVASPAVPIEEVVVSTRERDVDASAGIIAHTWGVEIKLQAVGLRDGASYSALVTTADGRRRSAGAFVGTGQSLMNCNLNSDVLRQDATRFTVVDDTGKTVLAAEL